MGSVRHSPYTEQSAVRAGSLVFTHVEKWLGCLDPVMDGALWQCCAQYNTAIPGMIVADAVFEAYTPDDYCARPPEMMAFLEIFGLDIIVVDGDPCAVYALSVRYPWMWGGTELLPVEYPYGFSGHAPCTQQIFP